MKRVILPLFVGVLFLTLQTTWLASNPIQRIRPDILLILTLYLGLSSSPISGVLLAFFLGYLMDLFSGNSFGLYAFSRPLIFYIAQLFKDRVYLESFPSRSLFVFILALVEGFLILILLKVLNPTAFSHLYPLWFPAFLPQSFCTALISPIFFSLFNRGSFLLFNDHRMGIGEKG